MERALEALKFHFRNGDTWTVHHQDISDLWIGRVTTSYGRIKGGHMTSFILVNHLRLNLNLTLMRSIRTRPNYHP